MIHFSKTHSCILRSVRMLNEPPTFELPQPFRLLWHFHEPLPEEWNITFLPLWGTAYTSGPHPLLRRYFGLLWIPVYVRIFYSFT